MSAIAVIKKTMLLFFVRIFTSLLSFLVVLFIARHDVELLGKFALVFAYFTIFTEIPLLGLNLFIARELSKRTDNFKPFFVIGNLLSYVSVIFLAGILASVMKWGGYPGDVTRALFWTMCALAPSAFITVAQTFFMAFENINTISVSIAAENTLRSVFALCILASGGGIAYIFFVFFVLRVVMFFANIFLLNRKKAFSGLFVWDRSLFLFTLGHWPVFSAIYILALLISKIDYIILSKLGSISDVGFYSASYKFLDVLLMAPTSLIVVLFPLFSRMQMADQSRMIVSGIVKYFAIACIPIVLFFHFGAKDILGFFYGEKYIASAAALSLLMVNLLITGCDQILSTLLITQNRQAQDLKMLIATFVVYLGGLFLLIPRLHYMGAAIATVVSSLLLLILKCLYVRGDDLNIHLAGLTKSAALGAGIWAAFTCLQYFIKAPSFVIWTFAMIGYICGIFIFKIISRDENRMIFGMLRSMLLQGKA